MSLNYLLDENVNPVYQIQLRRQAPDLVVRAVGDPATPPKGTQDPEILCWCEDYDFVLVTNNRKSMPVHLADHLTEGRHVPGIFILSPKLNIGETIQQLIFIAEASFENEYQDQIVHLTMI
ncbi:MULTISPECIES: DUF5615 family PIN-like protein [unclassified Moorena]|uniref:DUF5615 family PIN-like protein n=1 Tax=unclassified Moorena TaxID=2683338 RepID=UPI0013CDC9A9|nr:MULTISPECIES: DUF5615 family PIN-like protein [unclassified Moorena]NEO16799.1 hypothetical protein [Moorena sp. SIO3E8]NEO20913.1 hypothetical protein [Moorena sp. SIO4A5]NEQ03367.1 hypothetical protein [Moorena sp. SIO3F7]NEQ61810.1 hypothetical protein [Moorena sp. SIO4A1]